MAESWSRDRWLAHAQVFSSRFVLEWSGVPVCRPTSLVSAQHWRRTLHAQSVVCLGDEAATSCSLRCVLDYVAVEEEVTELASLGGPVTPAATLLRPRLTLTRWHHLILTGV